MTRRQTAWTFAIVVLAATTRLWGLGARFFHQDESTHAWMSFQLAEGHGYHIDPVYHGPFLYHLEAFAFSVLGSGDAQARLIPAVAGIAIVALMCFWLAAHVGKTAALVAGALATLSPSLTYYSRFNNHDTLVAALTVIMVTAPFEYRGAGLIWFAGACALAVATKLNAYFVIAALGGCFLTRTLYGWIRAEDHDALAYLRRQPVYLALAAAIGLLLQVLLGASTFAYHVQAADSSGARALARTAYSAVFGAVEYWWHMHQAPRLGGPAYYYAALLFIYEPLILIGVPIALVRFAKWRVRLFVALAAVALCVACVGYVSGSTPSLGGASLAALAAAFVLAAFWAVVSLWHAGRDYLACWVFVGISQFLLYAWANEKVPWLVVHVVLPWIVVVAAAVTELWRGLEHRTLRLLLGSALTLLVVMTAHSSWIVNTRNRSNVVEPMVQLDYAPEAAAAERNIVAMAAQAPQPLRIAIEPRVQWPFGWYLRRLQVDYVPASIGDDTDADVLIVEDRQLSAALQDRYAGARLPYARWSPWVARVAAGDLAGMVRFAVRHDRWAPEEGTYFGVWVRRDPSRARVPSGGRLP